MKKSTLIFFFILATTVSQSQNATLNIRAFIQGFYRGSGTMIATIDSVNYPAICDTMKVNLIDTSSTTYHVSFSSTSTISTTGYSSFVFPDSVIGGTYIIQLAHRNALTVFSKHSVTFNDTVMSYDFTVLPFQFCESGINSGDGYAMMCSGDINQDGYIDMSDFAIWDSANANFASGYLVSDLNGNWDVGLEDFAIWDNNNSNLAFSGYPNSCTVTNIFETINRETLSIFPNPTNGVVNISRGNLMSGEVNVFNVLGEKIYSEKIASQANPFQLTLHAPAGVYFVKIDTTGKQLLGKVIIE